MPDEKNDVSGTEEFEKYCIRHAKIFVIVVSGRIPIIGKGLIENMYMSVSMKFDAMFP